MTLKRLFPLLCLLTLLMAGRAGAQNNGTLVGSPPFVTGQAGFSQSLQVDGGYVTLADPSPIAHAAAASWTGEAWIYPTDGGALHIIFAREKADSSDWDLWLGLNGGSLAAYGSGFPGVVAQSGTVTLNTWHHVAVVITSGTSVTLYLDGVSIATSAITYAVPTGLLNSFIGSANAGGFNFAGKIDEVAFSDIAQYSAGFTPPSAPFSNSRAGQTALYHFDNDATDSNGLSPPNLIYPNNAAWVDSPGNWLDSDTAGITVSPGAYRRILFSGTSVTLNTSTGANTSPYPQFWVRVDGSPWTLHTLSAGNPSFLLASTLYSHNHLLEIVYKAKSTSQDIWATLSASFNISSITIDAGATVTAPPTRPYKIIIFGDSITEAIGVNANPAGGAQTTANADSLQGWAYNLYNLLPAEVGVVGIGAQGFTGAGGAEGVGNFTTTWNFLWEGQARTFSPSPDLVIINMGTNDSSGTSIVSAYETVLSGIHALSPSTKFLLVRPFNGNQATNIQAVAAWMTGAGLTGSYFDTTGLWSGADSADSLHPYGYSDMATLAPAIARAAQNLLSGTGAAKRRTVQ